MDTADLLKQVESLLDATLSKPPPSNIIELWKEHVEVRRALAAIESAQQKLGGETNRRLAADRRDQQCLDRFDDWCDAMHIARNNVKVAVGKEHGWELRATGRIDKDHVVVRVPRNAMISLDVARKSNELRRAFERDPVIGGMANIGLSLFVAVEWMKGQQSRWFDYINIFPKDFSTPLFYTEQQLLQLKPSPIFEESLMFYRAIARQFCYFLLAISKNKDFEKMHKNQRNQKVEAPPLYNTPFSVSTFTLQLYMWSVGVVTTRINMIPSEMSSEQMVPALIPMLDMANHETSVENEELVCFSPQEDCAVITSHSECTENDAVTIFYGRRSNGEHLLYNGFVPIGCNYFDVYKIKIGVPRGDKLFEARIKLMDQMVSNAWKTGNVFHFDLINNPKKPFDDNLITFASIFVDQQLTKQSINESKRKGLQFLVTRFTILERTYGDLDEKMTRNIGWQGDVTRLKSSELNILRMCRIYCELLEKNI